MVLQLKGTFFSLAGNRLKDKYESNWYYISTVFGRFALYDSFIYACTDIIQSCFWKITITIKRCVTPSSTLNTESRGSCEAGRFQWVQHSDYSSFPTFSAIYLFSILIFSFILLYQSFFLLLVVHLPLFRYFNLRFKSFSILIINSNFLNWFRFI